MPPSRITGLWDDGYALDFHTTGADFLGYDQFGHPQFDTHYTELGGLLHKLKYGSDSAAALPLVRVAAEFVRAWKVNVDVVIPVPPSRPRPAQPLIDVARRLAAELDLELDSQSLKKTRETPQLKGVDDFSARAKLLAGAFSAQGTGLNGRRVLLFDDLFRSGATLNAITKTLKDSGAAAVYALTLTRTRSRA